MRIKLRKTDIEFSKWLRKKIGRCERCGRPGGGEEGIEGLEVSHFWGRRNENTRFNLDNVSVLCFACHHFFHENPGEYRDWQLKKIGEERYKALQSAKNLIKKRDDKLDMMYIQKLKEE